MYSQAPVHKPISAPCLGFFVKVIPFFVVVSQLVATCGVNIKIGNVPDSTSWTFKNTLYTVVEQRSRILKAVERTLPVHIAEGIEQHKLKFPLY